MNILATWICLDTEENSSYFPSSKGFSSDFTVQQVYWKCLACSMFTARFYNPEIRLVVFSNTEELPVIDGVDFQALFQKLNVELHTTEFNYQTPEGYFNNWRNQFYEFSIFEYISNSPLFDESDKFCLIDSDCIISGSLEKIFLELLDNLFLNYKINYTPEHVINGLSREDMRKVFQKLEGAEVNEFPEYYGGEFLATSISGIKEINRYFKILWPKLIQLHRRNEDRLNEEAHVLSYKFLNLKMKTLSGINMLKGFGQTLQPLEMLNQVMKNCWSGIYQQKKGKVL